ncbi:MAG: nitrate reductase associated protein [Candidatus Binatia bacterium]
MTADQHRARYSGSPGADAPASSSSAAAQVDDLELIPRAVRDKLDRTGIKLRLREWSLLAREERQRLVDAPCQSAAEVASYATLLDRMVRARSGRLPDRLPPR